MSLPGVPAAGQGGAVSGRRAAASASAAPKDLAARGQRGEDGGSGRRRRDADAGRERLRCDLCAAAAPGDDVRLMDRSELRPSVAPWIRHLCRGCRPKYRLDPAAPGSDRPRGEA